MLTRDAGHYPIPFPSFAMALAAGDQSKTRFSIRKKLPALGRQSASCLRLRRLLPGEINSQGGKILIVNPAHRRPHERSCMGIVALSVPKCIELFHQIIRLLAVQPWVMRTFAAAGNPVALLTGRQ